MLEKPILRGLVSWPQRTPWTHFYTLPPFVAFPFAIPRAGSKNGNFFEKPPWSEQNTRNLTRLNVGQAVGTETKQKPSESRHENEGDFAQRALRRWQPANAPSARTILSPEWFEAVTATDGADGAFQFHSHDGGFDSVLTDHDLPDGTGAQFSELLRESGFKGRIIVLSGLLTEKDQAIYEKSAVEGFFRKPFKLQTIVESLLKALKLAWKRRLYSYVFAIRIAAYGWVFLAWLGGRSIWNI
jgi:CheY-like chemotaxis protein